MPWDIKESGSVWAIESNLGAVYHFADREEAVATLERWRRNGPCVECGGPIVDSFTHVEKLLSNKTCFLCDFWLDKADRAEARNSVRVNGEHYWIGVEDDSAPTRWRGHAGHRFNIRFFDGRKAMTTNLWSHGTIPDQFRERLPDNAEFVAEFD